MFKLVTVGVLLFLLYRLVVGPKAIGKGYHQEIENDTDEDFVEYEELD